MSVLLVGESPAKGTESRPDTWLVPGTSQSATRLLGFTGWTLERYLSVFRARTNLSRTEAWRPDPETRTRVLTHLDRGGRALFLGQRVARAIFPKGQKFQVLEWMVFAGGLVVVCPHPSGRSLWWNDLANRRRARDFFAGLEFEE